jgi:hypothetical protein
VEAAILKSRELNNFSLSAMRPAANLADELRADNIKAF